MELVLISIRDRAAELSNGGKFDEEKNFNVIDIYGFSFGGNDLRILGFEGNRATVSGVITSSSVQDLMPVGTLTRFGVVDNGEGEDNAADRMSRFNNFTSATCTTPVRP